MRTLALLATVTVLAAPPSPLRAATLSLPATQDAWIDENQPTANGGADAIDQVNSLVGKKKRTLLQFDVSGVPACAVLSSATLALRVKTNDQPAASRTHSVHRLGSPWTEGGVTWLTRDGTTAWDAPGGDFAAATASAVVTGTGALVQWNVAADVAAYMTGTPNDGWVVRDADVGTAPPTTIGYGSRTSAAPADRPALALELDANDAACDDGDPCTTDTCDPLAGCSHTAAPAGTACQDDGNPCTADVCDGADACTHPAGNAGAVCRPPIAPCDAAETCDGTSPACPADALAPAGTVCRPAAGPCDVAEQCTGVDAGCPADAKSTGVCRPAAGPCDVAEQCSGTSNACPADVLAPAATVCRAPATACDLPEFCTGTSAACPADTGEPDTDGDGVCDAQDVCPAVADPGQDDTDHDGLGDACDPCTDRFGLVATKAKIQVKGLRHPAGKQQLIVSGKKLLVPRPYDPPLDPSTKGLRVIVQDSVGTVIADATIPGGAFSGATQAGWKTKNFGPTWAYQNNGKVIPTVDGIIRASVMLSQRFDPFPSLSFQIIGKNGSYPVNRSHLPLRATIVIDAPVAASGQCGQVLFPGGASSCAFASQLDVVKCR